MKLLKKRGIAAIIDCFVFGFAIGACQFFIPGLKELMAKAGILLIFIFVPYFLKDLVFRNASLGKKILGLEVYDVNWRKPSLWLLIKRAAFTTVGSYTLWWKSKFTDGKVLPLLDWERDFVKAIVIDKKVLKAIKAEAERIGDTSPEKLTKLYNEYLIGIYSK